MTQIQFVRLDESGHEQQAKEQHKPDAVQRAQHGFKAAGSHIARPKTFRRRR